jgi:hypothetical protein
LSAHSAPFLYQERVAKSSFSKIEKAHAIAAWAFLFTAEETTMNTTIVWTVLTVTAALVSVEVQAAPVSFRSLQLAGTGCSHNTAVVSGKGTSTVSITFTKYDAASSSSQAASGMQRSSCNLIAPVKVAPGVRLSSITATWQGHAHGKTEFLRESFTAGQRGTSKKSLPTGNYTRRDRFTVQSGCAGGTVPLRINSSVRAKGKNSHIKMEKVRLHLHWRTCH